jgi:hypothetical protein
MPAVKSYAGTRPAHSGWRGLGWKVVLAVLIVLLLSLGIAVPAAVVWPAIWSTLLAWGALVVGISASNLLEGMRQVRWSWVALSVGAYAALAVPPVIGRDPSRLVEAAGPVAALTLAAHLARRDLPEALRDWSLVVGLALYFGLGVVAMAQVVLSFGIALFLVAVLFPPLISEAIALVLRRVDSLRGSALMHFAPPVVATLVALVVFSFGVLNRSTQPVWLVVFNLIAAVLIGGALLLSQGLRPLIEAASGANEPPTDGVDLRRALVELSHGPVLISIAVYLSLRIAQVT